MASPSMTSRKVDFSGRAAPSTGERSFAEVNKLLQDRGLSVCKTLLPGGRMQAGEWVCADLTGGKGRSFSVNVKEGVFKDFSGGEGGADFINLWAAVTGVSQHSAKIAAEQWMGLDVAAPGPRSAAAGLPASAEPEPEGDDGQWWRGLRPEHRWDYVDADGVVFAATYRFKHPVDGRKAIRPWDFTTKTWSVPEGRRPLLYTQEIVKHSGPIIVVEGEKTCDAVNELPDLRATTTLGGSAAVAKADWSALANRDVILWRDNDAAGVAWEEKVTAELKAVNATSVRAVVVPAGKPEGWDAADTTLVERRKLLEAAAAAKPLHQAAPLLRIGDWTAARFTGAAPERTYLVNTVFPANVYGVVAAQGDTGKGMMLLHLCLQVAGGAPDPVLHPMAFGASIARFGRVVLFSAEDDMAELHRRLASLDPEGRLRKRAGDRLMIVPLPNVGGARALIRSTGRGPELTDDFERIRDQLGALDDLALSVFDPLASFVLADLNKDAAAGQAVGSAFAALATSLKTTVLAAHHMRKTGGADKQITTLEQARDSIRGSTALIDSARMAYALWPAGEKDAKLVLSELGEAFQGDAWRNRVVNGGVVKSNGPADRTLRTYVRDAGGLLIDRTNLLVRRIIEMRDTLEVQLVEAVREGAAAGRPYQHTSKTAGLFALRERLPTELKATGKGKMEAVAQKLIERGEIVKCVAAGSKNAVWLDVPGGMFAKGEGIFESGAAPVIPEGDDE